MEQQTTEAEPRASTPSADCGSSTAGPPTPPRDIPPAEQREWSDSSLQSSKESRPSEESKPQESSQSQTDSSPYRKQSLGTLSNALKDPETPQSQKTPQATAKSKVRCCIPCNPVYVCLVLGMAIATGSVAMTACGYMSHEIAMQTIVVGNDTVTTIDEELRDQVEKFRTFGPVLIGLGSFIAMCACVLMCEARDEKIREANKLLEEDQDYEDIHTRQEHMFALQCEVMNSNTRRKSTSCPQLSVPEPPPHIPHKQLDDVAYADESSHSSPVVLVHGPSLADERQRNDSQESNEGDAAKAILLQTSHQEGSQDVSGIPTCSNVPGPSRPQVETTFPATQRTFKNGGALSSPPLKDTPRLERPTQLSPIISRSVNGPISVKPLPPVEGVCLCGGDPVYTTPPPPSKNNSKRVKRGTRQKKKKKHPENRSVGSDSGSAKSVPKSTKNVATQNTDLVTHVNPLHDIPLVKYPSISPERTGSILSKPDTCGAVSRRTELPSGSLAPVESTTGNRPIISRKSDRLPLKTALKGTPKKDQTSDANTVVWVKQQPRDSPSKDLSHESDKEGSPRLAARGAMSKHTSEKTRVNRVTVSEPPCDSNSNVSTTSSMHLSPKATPSNVTYDVIHDKGQQVHSSKSQVVL